MAVDAEPHRIERIRDSDELDFESQIAYAVIVDDEVIGRVQYEPAPWKDRGWGGRAWTDRVIVSINRKSTKESAAAHLVVGWRAIKVDQTIFGNGMIRQPPGCQVAVSRPDNPKLYQHAASMPDLAEAWAVILDKLPVHYFDCERFNVDHAGHRGICDCGVEHDFARLAEVIGRLTA